MPGWRVGFLIISLFMQSGTLKAGDNDAFKSLMREGEHQYQKVCAACHQTDGSGMPLDAPPLRHGLINSSFITTDKPISTHIEMVLNGVAGTQMMGFANTLNNQQIAAIVTYERNAWGNNTHDVVTAADVEQLRDRLAQTPPPVDMKARTRQELMFIGQATYRTHCARCHQLSGAGAAPNGPSLLTSHVAMENDLISYKIELLLQGVAGTRMRSYAKQLNDLQLAAVTTYIGNAWNKSSQPLIQPRDIQIAREKLRTKLAIPAAKIDKDRTMTELLKLGRYVYLTNCVRFHLTDGQGGAQPGVPALRGSKIATQAPINNHIDIVLTGVPTSIMRAFGPRLNNAEIAAVVTYERNSFGNHTGDIVQPNLVKKERERLQKVINYQQEHQLMQQYEFENKKSTAAPISKTN